MRTFCTIFLILFDLLAINILFSYKLGFLFNENPIANMKTFIGLMILCWLLITAYFKLYSKICVVESVDHFTQFFKSYFIAFIFTFLSLTSVFSENILFPKRITSPLLWFFFLFGVIACSARMLFFLFRKNYREFFSAKTKTLVIGNNGFTEKLFENPLITEKMGIKGIYNNINSKTPSLTTGKIRAAKRLLGLKTLETILICENAIGQQNFEDLTHITSKLMIRIFVIPDLKGVDLTNSSVTFYNGIPVIKPMTVPLESINNRIVKRSFDILFSLLVIIFILSWLTPILALLIYLEDPGPVFFRQKRSGYLNHEFKCIKFRSMTINKQADQQTATKNDKRLTKLGAFLRKSSIDELPQFFNVLKGEMSVCGPRPHMISQTDMYSDEVKKYMVRHFVLPGITGWAQVTGARGEIHKMQDMENRVAKDNWYIQNWSLVLDLKIIFLTIYNIFRGDKQAY